ncbi:unnamed protein product, partial [Ectocarpus sp. 12 AP-2014]
TATSTGGTRRLRTRPAALVPRSSPCLIDLWTGKIVARNALETSPLSPSGRRFSRPSDPEPDCGHGDRSGSPGTS